LASRADTGQPGLVQRHPRERDDETENSHSLRHDGRPRGADQSLLCLIAANLPLTETEATKFWPIYDQYAAEMAKNNDALDALLKEYAANQKTLTDAQAEDMLKRWSTWQVSLAQTRQKYIPIVGKVLPGKKSALFFQIDRRLYTLMDVQIASEIPLVIQ
jgi:hypothetical protein